MTGRTRTALITTWCSVATVTGAPVRWSTWPATRSMTRADAMTARPAGTRLGWLE